MRAVTSYPAFLEANARPAGVSKSGRLVLPAIIGTFPPEAVVRVPAVAVLQRAEEEFRHPLHVVGLLQFEYGVVAVLLKISTASSGNGAPEELLANRSRHWQPRRRPPAVHRPRQIRVGLH